jgi:hypothetical protein
LIEACTTDRELGLQVAIDPAAIDAVVRRFSDCVAGIYRPRGDFALAGAGLVLAVAVALYLVAPWWRRRRDRLVPLTNDDAPELLEELGRLSREAGLETPPAFLWSPLDQGVRAVAFGRVRERAVALTGGLVVLSAVDPPAFRAIVHHELAHLRNRDIDITYLTVSVWQAFLVVALLPFGVSLLFATPDSPETAVQVGWRLALLAGLVYLTRNAVLRAREVYADVRAAVHEPEIRRVLAGAAPPTTTRPWLLRLHPTAAERMAAIDDPGRLLQLGWLEAFGVGIASTVAFQQVVSLVGIYVPIGLTTMWLAALVFAPFASAVVAMGAWRETFLALAHGRTLRRALPLGMALGAGFLVGDRIAISGLVFDEDAILGTAIVGSDAIWAVVVLVALVLFVGWVGAAASVWIPAATGMRSAWPTSVAGLVAAGGLLTVAMGVFVLARATRDALGITEAMTQQDFAAVATIAWATTPGLWRLVMDPMVLTYVAQPTVTLGLVTVWAFPLAAAIWLRRLPVVVAPPWGVLNGAAPAIAIPHLRIRRAVAIGAAGGVATIVVYLALRLVARAALTDGTRDQLEFAYLFYFWSVGLALIAQVIVAGIVAATTERVPAVHALLAAWVTGLVAAVGYVGLPTVAGCLPMFAVRFVNDTSCELAVEVPFAVRTIQHVVSLGFVASLVSIAIVFGGRSAARRVVSRNAIRT